MSDTIRIAELENKLEHAKLFARLLWRNVRADKQKLAADELDYDGQRVLDAAFDAAETVWERHKIFVEQTAPAYDRRFTSGPNPHNDELYLCIHPNGEHRTISREQLLMMGGKADPDIIGMRPGL